MALKCEVVHNPNRTPEDDQIAYRSICEIYREFHEREAKRKSEKSEESSKMR